MLIVQINIDKLTEVKIAELLLLCRVFNIDILCINETWLKTKDNPKTPGYQPFRFDRPLEQLGMQRGGGVLTLVKDGIKANDLGNACIDGVEMQKVEVHISKVRKLTITNVYCPPPLKITAAVSDYLKSAKNSLILGDFNAKDPELGSKGRPDDAGKALLSMITNNRLRLLSQGLLTFTSWKGNKEALDLILATEDVAKLATGVEILPDVGSNHVPIAINIRDSTEHPKAFPELRLALNKAKWDQFIDQLTESSERVSTDKLCSPEAIDKALAELEAAYEKSKTASIPTVKANDLRAWRPTREIIVAIQQRRRARRLFERLKTTEARTVYNRASKAVKKLIAKERTERFRQRCDELSKLLKEKPRLFWKEFNALATNKNASDRRNYPPIESGPNIKAYTDGDKANVFAHHLGDKTWITPDDPSFCKGTAELVNRTLAKASNDYQHPVAKPRKTAGRWQFYTDETIKVVKSLKSTAPGEDGMLNAILKHAPRAFWQKATDIFNACMRLSHVPAKWKHAIVCMIPKEGKDWKTVKGYRPISLLNSLAKIMERLVARRVTGELRARRILPECQSAFLSKHSVEDHPFRLAELASTGLLNGEDTIVVCLDVEGAFDRVWHQGLLYKMRSFGFPDCALAWMANFLDNRSFKVRIGNSHSKTRHILGGVPQGSPLSPILYVLYTADLVRELPKTVTKGLFADDIALAKRSKHQAEAIATLNYSLAKVYEWFCKWRLKINATKSQALRISNKRKAPPANLSINGEAIEWAQEVKYLGVWLDRKLLWRKQLATSIAKARNRLAALHSVCRRRFGLTSKAAITVYKTYIEPVLTFGSQAWLGISSGWWEKLELVQRIALRIALRLPKSAPKREIASANIDSIKLRIATLATNWLSRALIDQNLVGKEILPRLNAEIETRTYRQGIRTPLASIQLAALDLSEQY